MLGAYMGDVTPNSLFSIAFGSATDVGKRRSNNEDSSRCTVLAEGQPEQSVLLVLSDGVGGAKAGEVASKLAVESLLELLSDRERSDVYTTDFQARLESAIREVDRRVQAASNQPGLSGMGATLSSLWITGSDVWWGQAGDSRIYLLRDGELRQISHDQSPVGRLRASGELTEEEARMHPYRHVIDPCLGGGSVTPETGQLAPRAGDVLLLCSDGLSDGLWDREIREGLRLALDGRSPEDVATALVAQANLASGKDNITAVVARIDAALPA